MVLTGANMGILMAMIVMRIIVMLICGMVVCSMVVRLMIVIPVSMGMALISQDQHADAIHYQTDDRHDDRLVVVNRDWIDDA